MSCVRCGTLILLLSFVVGCGGGVGSLTGKISYKDQPLNSGSITIESSAGEVQTAAIGKDGLYTVSGLSSGPAKVSITVPPPPAPGPDGVSADLAEGVPVVEDPVLIPEKYGQFSTSGLTVTVEGGSQTYDISLE